MRAGGARQGVARVADSEEGALAAGGALLPGA